MNIPKKQQRKILDSATEPSDRNFLWLDVSGRIPILKRFTDGKWVSIIDTTIRPYDGNDEKPTPTPEDLSEYAKVSWVNSKVNPISTRLSNVILSLKEYVKKSELPEFPDIQSITSSISEIKNAVRRCVTLEYLNYTYKFYLDNTYQKKLTAGAGINIDGNNVIKSTVSADIESIQHDISSINTALLNKQDILEPGPNISISGNTISASISGGGTSVQPDWDQTDENSADYINNKPDLDTLFNAKQDKLESGVNIVTINGNSLLGGGNLNIKGGSGSGSSVDVVQEGADTSDNNTLYFFSPSPLQAEGLYNNLLRDGQVNSVLYSPGILYNLNELGGFNRIQNKSDYIRVEPETNRVYCCGQLTALKNVGTLVVSHKRKYADTSDTAYISMTVSMPFYQSSMRVYINVPTDDGLTIQRRTANGVWTNVDNGSYITFHNNRPATINNANANSSTDVSPNLFDFRVIRADSNNDNYTSRLDTSLTFTTKYDTFQNTGVPNMVTCETFIVELIYPSCKLFYKNGVTYSPFAFNEVPDITENSSETTNPEQYYLYSKGLYYNNNDSTLRAIPNTFTFKLPSNTQSKKLAMRVGDVTVNMGNYNVFYAVVTSYYYPLSLCVYQSEYTEGINYGSSDTLWYTKSTSNDQEEKNNVEKRGSHVQKCVIQRVNQPYNLNLVLYLMHATSASHNIKEVGLLTY